MLHVGICGVVTSILLDSISQNILFRLCFCPFAVYSFFRESAGPPKIAKSVGPAAYAASAIWLIRPWQKLWMRKNSVIKTCDQGKPRFDVLALQQPEDADAKGLKSSLDCAIDKAKLTIDRKSREIGLGSDGTNTNKPLYRLEKEEIGDHLILVLCVSHKLELAIHDAFKNSKLNDAAEEQLVVRYYIFKRANLKWRLFKRHYC